MILNRRTLLKTVLAGSITSIPFLGTLQALPYKTPSKKWDPDWNTMADNDFPSYHSVSLIAFSPSFWDMRWVAYSISNGSWKEVLGKCSYFTSENLHSSWVPIKKNPTKNDITNFWDIKSDIRSKNIYTERHSLSFHKGKEYYSGSFPIRWIDAFDLVTQSFIPFKKCRPAANTMILLKDSSSITDNYCYYAPMHFLDLEHEYSFGTLNPGIVNKESELEWIELPPLSY